MAYTQQSDKSPTTRRVAQVTWIGHVQTVGAVRLTFLLVLFRTQLASYMPLLRIGAILLCDS